MHIDQMHTIWAVRGSISGSFILCNGQLIKPEGTIDLKITSKGFVLLLPSLIPGNQKSGVIPNLFEISNMLDRASRSALRHERRPHAYG